MLAYFDAPIGWGELVRRTVREVQSDNGLGLAAELAYYFFLALFPTLLFLIAVASFLPAEDLVGRVLGMLGGAAPPDILNIVRDQVVQLSQRRQGGILTFGVAAALWSSSAAMVALMDSLNRAYGVEDARAWWKQRLTAILLTIGLAVLILASFTLVLAGPELAELVASWVGLGAVFEWTWKIVQWPLVFALVATAIGLVYYFAPDVDQDWVWLTPGSVTATLLWLGGSFAFRFYVESFGSYNETYGAIGGVMVLLLWLYLSGLVIIIGAEMNAEIEHASPHGKAAGEKVPGERKTVGPRAVRALRDRQVVGPPPAPESARSRRRTSSASAVARVGVVVSGAIAALSGRRVKS